MARKNRRQAERDYEMPPTLMAVYRHPRTRVLHFRNECQAMKYGKSKMQPLLLRGDLMKRKGNLPGAMCRYCFGSTDG